MHSKGNWKKEGYTIKVNDPFHHPKGSEYIVDVFDEQNQEAAYFKFDHLFNHAKHGNCIHVMDAEVMLNHRRKGIASAVYQKIEELCNSKICNELEEQTEDAQLLWNQKNRSFGQ